VYDGAKIIAAKSNSTNTDTQLWKVEKVGDYYKIESKSSGKAIDVANIGVSNGDYLQLWQYSQQANQHWSLETAEAEDPNWENLSTSINTLRSEISPCFSIDGKVMYYTTGITTQMGVINGDIFQSELQADGKWSKGKLVTELSNVLHNVVFGIFPAMFSITSKSPKGGWDFPRTLAIRTPQRSQPTWGGAVGSDGKTILIEMMTSNVRYDADMYVSFQKENGEWTDALNLGPVINKVGFFDGSPYLAPDMTTLYFSSSRDGGRYTHFYMSKRLDETWQNWSEPVLMGEGIYKEGGMQYYNVPGNGEYAYFVSHTKSYGESDILRKKLKTEEKPEPFMVVTGRTLDKKTNKPIGARISFEDITTKQIMGNTVSDPITGAYQIALPKGKNYGIYAAAPKYYAINDNIDLTKLEIYKELSKDCFLVPLEIGQTVKLNNVFFERKMSVVKAESFPELDRLAQIMKDNKTMEIELQGHTENLGDPAKNQVLSEERVAATKKYLVGKGIDISRIKGKGFGGTKPVGQGTTAEAQKLNRRVEFMILKN
jgi:outer membrane protein OmpA-like peptidoglycan-associated protein